MARMVVPRLIERKRDGQALAPAEWRALVEGYVAGDVPDYQMSALAMAIVWRGLEPAELAALTEAMLHSGARLSFDGLARPVVDKHSTGGVGDKTSILLAPMLAAEGLAIPMISGRGLGHTGGTLDKLEAIPGFRTNLSLEQATEQVRDLGVVMLGQTPEIVPADKKLYGLRDVTGTVESIPLISASIMSKKLAEDLDGLVIDLKTGSGAFMQRMEDALELARTMIGIGEAHGTSTVALLTAMDRPLGYACGNALEIEESIAGLAGGGPADLMEVTYALGVEMLVVGGVETDRGAARKRLEGTVSSGRALEMLRRLIGAQGGSPAIVDDPAGLPQAPRFAVFEAPRAGVVAEVTPRVIGHAVVALGGGRSRTDDVVDPAVGFSITAKPGVPVGKGEPLATVYARDDAGLQLGLRALADAITITDDAVATPLISHRVTKEGVEILG